MTVGGDGLQDPSIVFEVDVPVAPTALVTLDDVYDHLNINNPNASTDIEVQGFINAATAFIQDITGPIIPISFTESHDGGGTIICLNNPPVLTVDSLVEYVGPTGYTLTQVAPGIDGGAYAFSLDNPASGIIRRRWSGGLVAPFIGGDRNIVVSYTAGRSSVPADIRMAVLQDIAGIYQPSQNGPAGNGMYSDPGAGPSQPLNPIGLFPRVAEILSAAKTRTPSIA